MAVKPAHRCDEFGSITGPGKHHPSEHVFNPHLSDRDYCVGCLRPLVFVQHSSMNGMDWITIPHMGEWP